MLRFLLPLVALLTVWPSLAFAQLIEPRVFVHEDTAFAAEPSGALVARDVRSGKTLWRSKKADAVIWSADGVLIARGPAEGGFRLLLMSGDDGKVIHSFVPIAQPKLASMDFDGHTKSVGVSEVEGRLIVSWSWAEKFLGGRPSEKPLPGAWGFYELVLRDRLLRKLAAYPAQSVRAAATSSDYAQCGELSCKFDRTETGWRLLRRAADQSELEPLDLPVINQRYWDLRDRRYLMITPGSPNTSDPALFDTTTGKLAQLPIRWASPKFVVIRDTLLTVEDDVLHAINATTGKTRWTRKLAPWFDRSKPRP